VGAAADITIIDTECKYKVDASRLVSKGKNSAYNGMDVKGRAACTIVGGRVVYNIMK